MFQKVKNQILKKSLGMIAVVVASLAATMVHAEQVDIEPIADGPTCVMYSMVINGVRYYFTDPHDPNCN